MIKSLYATSIASYGPELPSGTNFPDGALFIKTTNPDSGIYVFSFSQDTDSALGEQPGQQWYPVSADVSGLFLPITGGTLSGDLNVGGVAGVGGVSVKRNTASTSNPGVISFTNGSGVDQSLFGWNEANSRFELTGGWTFTATPTVNGSAVWHAGNDGAGSTLDADLLDGQHGAYYQNASNTNAGTLALAHGGTSADLSSSSPGSIIYRAASTLAATTAGTPGQVLLSGGTGAPSWASQSALSVGFATNAGSAISATTANTATNVAWSGVTGADKPDLTQSGTVLSLNSPNVFRVGTAPSTGVVVLTGGDSTISGGITFGNPSVSVGTIGFASSGIQYNVLTPTPGVHAFSGGAVTVNHANIAAGPHEVGFRQIPKFAVSGAYTISNQNLVGYCIEQTTAGNITVANSVFTAGHIFSIFNNTPNPITIIQDTALTMYGPSGTTGNRVLEARGLCTVWFSSASVCKITGEIY